MNNKVKALTQGALMVALMGVFLVINRQTGEMLEFYGAFILPLPLIVYASQYGGKASMIPLVAITLLSMMIGLPTSVFTVLHASITGVIYGYGVYHRKSDRFLLGTITVATIIYYVVTTWLLASIFNIDLQAEALSIINFIQSQGYTNIMGMSMVKAVSYLLPNLIIFTAILQALLIHMLARVLLNRLHLVLMPAITFYQLIIPKWLGWFLLINLCIAAGANMLQLNIPMADLFNFVAITSLLIFIMYGLLYTTVWFGANGWRKWIIIVYALMFIIPSLMVPLFIIIGALGVCVGTNRPITAGRQL